MAITLYGPITVEAGGAEWTFGEPVTVYRIRPEVLDLTSGAQLVTRVEEQGRALRLQVADSPVVIRIGD